MNDESIFTTALDITDLVRRAAYLDEACAGDPALRGRVERLLAAHDKASAFLERPAAGLPDPAAATLTLGTPDGDPNTTGDAAFLQPSSRPGALGRIGHYDVLEVLGRGGFGIVYRALDDVLQRVVAIKVLSPQMAATSPARKRFVREARSSAAIRHENVVQVYAVEDHPLPYLVMEFIPGESLQSRIDRTGPLDVAEALRTGRQIAEGLAAAHATGLIHRDVKPANVLIENGPNERVKLTDFGLARAVDDASLTQSGVVAGTPMYMSPEQAKGEALDHRSDLFSLGSVLYAMLTGRPPFRASGSMAVLKRVCDEQPRPIREVIPEVPEWLCRIVEKLHAKNPDERFQTAREVADVLADCERQLQAHGALKDAGRIPEAKPAPSPSRGGWKWAAALAVLALPVVAAVFYALAGSGPQPGWEGAEKSDPSAPVLPPPSVQGGDERPRGAPPLAVAPFDAEKAKEHQEAWAKYLGVPVEFENSIGMKFRLIPPGEYSRGTPQEDIDRLVRELPPDRKYLGDLIRGEGPVRRVAVTRAFYLGTHEVTNDQFWAFADQTGYRTADEANGLGGEAYEGLKLVRRPDLTWRAEAKRTGGDNPVGFMIPADADAFCDWLRAKDGRGYALPTEDQWEYACRAGTTGRRFCPDDRLAEFAQIDPPSGVAPVGQKRPNPFGLYDVLGNRQEMARSPDAVYHRGGACVGRDHVPFQLRSAFRCGIWKGGAVSARPQGFRVAIVGDLKPKPSFDKERLQGAWVAESAESLGQPLPAEGVMRLEFSGGNVRVSQPGGPAKDGTFKIDSGATPKEIDVIRYEDEKGMRGIYRFDGDKLILCIGEPSPTRPREFRTAPDTGSLLLVTMRRAANASLPAGAVVPFDAKQAAAHQEEWAKFLGTKVEFADKRLGMTFRVIPPGDFLMGLTEDEVKPEIAQAEKEKGVGWRLWVRSLRAQTPQHPVRITRPFAIGTCEVTVGQFKEFAKGGYKTEAEQNGGFAIIDGKVVPAKKGYRWDNVGYAQVDNAPVWNVSRDDAVEFCKWLSKQDGRTFRLPTEAEWEWACRAGTSTRTYWGAERAADAERFAVRGAKANSTPQPVGKKFPNAFGLHDMCGNVWEWCNDWYSEGYYKESPVADPPGPAGATGGALTNRRVWRGGGVDGTHLALTSTARPIGDHRLIGFRVVCEIAGDARLPPPPEAKKPPPDPAVAERRKEVEARSQARDTVQQRLDAGVANKLELLAAEVDLTEAQIKLEEAKKNPEAVANLLEELVAFRQEERELIAERVKVGKEPRSALDAADARLADAKARLAKLRPPDPDGPPP